MKVNVNSFIRAKMEMTWKEAALSKMKKKKKHNMFADILQNAD